MTGFAVLRAACAAVALAVLMMWLAGRAAAQNTLEDRLLDKLATAPPEFSLQLERRILELWSDSGSPSLNLLLQRGRAAMASGDFGAAIGDFSELIDRAPEFAEGWNARATAWFLIGEYGLSVSDIAITLELNEQHFGALNGLAMIMERFGEDETALKVYEDIMAIHPNRAGLSESMNRLRKKLTAKSI